MTIQEQKSDKIETERWNGKTVNWPEADDASVILIKGDEHSVAYLLADLVVVAAFKLDRNQPEFVMAAMADWNSKERKGSLSILGIGGFPHQPPPILPPTIPVGIPQGYLLVFAALTAHLAASQLHLVGKVR